MNSEERRYRAESQFAQLDRLLETWEGLGEGERNILLVLAMRIKAGQRKFGPLTRDKKDWLYEALEEHLDATVYLACALEAKAFKAFQNIESSAVEEVKAGDPAWTRSIERYLQENRTAVTVAGCVTEQFQPLTYTAQSPAKLDMLGAAELEDRYMKLGL